MKQNILIVICIIFILTEGFFIIYNTQHNYPILTNAVLFIGFLGALYVIGKKDDK